MPRPSPQTDRVITTINLLASTDGGATLTQIAQAVGQDPSTCQHMLAALTASGFLVREPSDRRYHLGPALVAAGQVALRRYPLLAAARPEMEALSRRFEVPCYAFAPDGDHARLVHVTAERGAPNMAVRTGETVPLAPPLGALFVAWGGEAVIEGWLDAAPALDEAARSRYRAVLGDVRAVGYVAEALPASSAGTDVLHLLQDRASPWRDRHLRALLANPTAHIVTDLDDAAHPAMVTVGAPVLDRSGTVVLTLSVAGAGHELGGADIATMGAAVSSAASRVAAVLGR